MSDNHSNSENNNQESLPPGFRILFYELIQKLGRGAFGIAYLALDTQRNCPVVLKEYFPINDALRMGAETQVSVISSSKQSDFDEGLRYFRREAQLLGEFNHPNVVKVIGLFDANNTAYFVMEHVEGQLLQDKLEDLSRPFTEAEIQRDFLPILNGLQAVHDKGILHLDIKPDNILTSKYGQPRLIDFGVACYATEQALDLWDYYNSMLFSSWCYAPAERYSLKQQLTPATDIYAVGMTLYKLMAPSVELPSSRDRQTELIDGFADPLPPIRDVAKGYSDVLYRVVEACTQTSKLKRPQTVAEVQQMLGGF